MGMFHVKRSRYANLVQENEMRRGSGRNRYGSNFRGVVLTNESFKGSKSSTAQDFSLAVNRPPA
jgi:hypothetical protein